jgi:formyltetrahydrofolate-dependent phosphoribosylglycinamide formyltransferase
VLEKLQRKWQVTGKQLILVLCVFAIGGSATGYFGKIIMNWLAVDRGWLWTLIYIIVVTLIWPLNVLLVSIPFGQFSFFSKYLRRMGSRIGLINQQTPPQNTGKTRPNTISAYPDSRHAGGDVLTTPALPTDAAREVRLTHVAIFASGAGSNARKIIDHFRNHPAVRVVLVACNKAGAGVLTIAESEKIPTLFLEKEKFFSGNGYVGELKSAGIDFIVLAGFLWKIPQALIDNFRNKIINIHPALLPKYGGKGMYGNLVHEAVIQAGEKESGITIHYVDEHYDNGDIIFQARVSISDNETPESLAAKIHALEHSNFPRVIEGLLVKPIGR